MIIHVYSLCYNEEEILPLYLRHYKQFTDKIIVYDNHSTDNSVKILKENDVDVRTFTTNNTFDDIVMLNMWNNMYKESRGVADWVVVCCIDEFLYHPNIRDVLKTYKIQGANIARVEGFNMLAEDENVYEDLSKLEGQIYDTIKTGTPWEGDNKFLVFNPGVDINYQAGCHVCSPEGWYPKFSADCVLKNLHYSLRGKEKSLQKNQAFRDRMSENNKNLNLGFHRMDDNFFLESNYYMVKNNLRKVI